MLRTQPHQYRPQNNRFPRPGHADLQQVRSRPAVRFVFEVQPHRLTAGSQPQRNPKQRRKIHRLASTDRQLPGRPQRGDIVNTSATEPEQGQHLLGIGRLGHHGPRTAGAGCVHLTARTHVRRPRGLLPAASSILERIVRHDKHIPSKVVVAQPTSVKRQFSVRVCAAPPRDLSRIIQATDRCGRPVCLSGVAPPRRRHCPTL